MSEVHGVVCTGPCVADVADALRELDGDLECVESPLEASERVDADGCLVLAVDESTDASIIARVRAHAPDVALVVVANDVSAELAAAAVDADVTALCTPDDDVAEVVADAVTSATSEDEIEDAPLDGPVDGPVDVADDWRTQLVDRLFETTPDRLVVFEPDGTVAHANDRAREDFAISTGESRTGDVDVHDEDDEYVPAAARPWMAVFRTCEASYGHQYRLEPDGGEAVWYVVDVVPLGDGPEAAFASFRDVTDDERDRERLREHRTQVEHERERLEYVNRLLRHNLLNSLNVAHARTNLLEGHVDPAAEEHLDTATSRLDEMIDFVETMRSLMHILVGDDHDVGPVALDAVLDGEVAKLAEAYDVTVHADDLPRVAVAADDLLPEVFENLLVNAVQHNDTDHPAVFVDVEVNERAKEAVVYVADNGPGVPPEMRDGLFQKGEKGFDSPGTGFGLYLVRETVDAYGGSVDVVDDDHDGATFAVTLPLAETTIG